MSRRNHEDPAWRRTEGAFSPCLRRAREEASRGRGPGGSASRIRRSRATRSGNSAAICSRACSMSAKCSGVHHLMGWTAGLGRRVLVLLRRSGTSSGRRSLSGVASCGGFRKFLARKGGSAPLDPPTLRAGWHGLARRLRCATQPYPPVPPALRLACSRERTGVLLEPGGQNQPEAEGVVAVAPAVVARYAQRQ
jgi:hypothetical protein